MMILLKQLTWEMTSKMSNDNQLTNDTQQTLTLTRDDSLWNNVKTKINKYLPYIKPNLINVLLTFLVLIILITVTKKIGLTAIISVISYFIFAILVNPFVKIKVFSKLNFSLANKRNAISVLNSTNNKMILLTDNKYFLGISLIKLEWTNNFISLNSIWDFLQEENLQLQDCREGSFMVVRKKIPRKRTKNLQEQVTELTKEMEKTILLIKKKFEIEFDFFQLKLVKGKKNILTILNLGLSVEKFKIIPELSEEEFDNIREESKIMIGA